MLCGDQGATEPPDRQAGMTGRTAWCKTFERGGLRQLERPVRTRASNPVPIPVLSTGVSRVGQRYAAYELREYPAS